MTSDGGIGRLKARLAAIPREVKDAARVATLRQASTIAETMQRMAPDGPKHAPPDDLRRSIAVTPGNTATPPYSQPGGSVVVPELAVAITAGNEEVRYAHLVEYGTAPRIVKKTGKSSGVGPAQPFFWPAFRLHRKRAVAGVKRGISAAVKKNWGKGS